MSKQGNSGFFSRLLPKRMVEGDMVRSRSLRPRGEGPWPGFGRGSSLLHHRKSARDSKFYSVNSEMKFAVTLDHTRSWTRHILLQNLFYYVAHSGGEVTQNRILLLFPQLNTTFSPLALVSLLWSCQSLLSPPAPLTAGLAASTNPHRFVIVHVCVCQ